MSISGYYFGYGSLVNRDTRAADEPWHKATLKGWKRQWAHQAARPWALGDKRGGGVCAVTVEPCENTVIDGVLVPVAEDSLVQLDKREAGYHRVMLPLSDFSLHDSVAGVDDEDQVIVYVSNPENNQWANGGSPLIISYVHCVMAGFEKVYGESGLERFMLTTEGWSLPLLDDRHQSIYPRAVMLDAQKQANFDQKLEHFASRAASHP